MPSVAILDPKAKQELLGLFERLGASDFPPLMSQLRDRWAGRVELDSTLSRVLRVPGFDSDEKLFMHYSRMVEKLEGLRKDGGTKP